jgi:SCY1-like protein 2
MVEPLEETRNELIFATEPILSSLQLSIPGCSRYSPLVELDEIEVCVLQETSHLFYTDSSNRYKKASCNYAKASNSCIRQLG